MESGGIFGLCMVVVTGLISYKGITDHSYLQRYAFDVDAILIRKDYKRLFTSGFLHTSWMHLIFNMLALHSFSTSLEFMLGFPKLLLLYFGSLLGGNLLALYIHRNHDDYRAVGASGAISGLIFGSIAVFPGMSLSLFFLPYHIPSWAFGILYVLYCIYGIKAQRDSIGHEAHLGGGLTGLIIAIALFPFILRVNIIPILLILIPAGIFLYLIITRPHFLLVDNPFQNNPRVYTKEDKYNTAKIKNEQELDRLLDKISKTGLDGLTKYEKERLEKLSNPK
jgi:membrane associated rhomboid family serine protease